jgi:probable 2-oxoglutarate dehydrogenase E1 component DHKTD1
LEYQRKFAKEIFVEIHCFRRWGHNELDDPTFTNPLLYNQITSRRTVPDFYAQESGFKNDEILGKHSEMLATHFAMVDKYEPTKQNLKGNWTGIVQPGNEITEWDTGLQIDLLKYVGARSVKYPEEFNIHGHLKKHHVDGRLKKLQSGAAIDWGLAEALALGSLLYQVSFVPAST